VVAAHEEVRIHDYKVGIYFKNWKSFNIVKQLTFEFVRYETYSFS